jgi:threonine aldolase
MRIEGLPISFASDNHAGAHPRVLEAIAAANAGYAVAYGADPWTARLGELVRSAFGPRAEAFPVFNGTGANVVSIASALRPWEAVVCAERSHIDVDECGAPEAGARTKLLVLRTPDQKLNPEMIRAKLARRGDVHAVQPRMISITQSTELGTVYSLEEIRAIAALARAEGLLLHIDGSRLANAAVSLGCSLREVVEGADLVSFGATKNGALGAEAVVCLDPAHADTLRFARKQSMQLASKMRFVSAQLVALLEGDLWKENATAANRMATLLAEKVRAIPGVTVTQKTQANAVFASLPADRFEERVKALQSSFPFYVWDEPKREVRWMTSFATREEDVSRFTREIEKVLR